MEVREIIEKEMPGAVFDDNEYELGSVPYAYLNKEIQKLNHPLVISIKEDVYKQSSPTYWIGIHPYKYTKKQGKKRYTLRLWVEHYPIYKKCTIAKHGKVDFYGFEELHVPKQAQIAIKNIIFICQTHLIDHIQDRVLDAMRVYRKYNCDWQEVFKETFLRTRYNQRTYVFDDYSHGPERHYVTFIRAEEETIRVNIDGMHDHAVYPFNCRWYLDENLPEMVREFVTTVGLLPGVPRFRPVAQDMIAYPDTDKIELMSWVDYNNKRGVVEGFEKFLKANPFYITEFAHLSVTFSVGIQHLVASVYIQHNSVFLSIAEFDSVSMIKTTRYYTVVSSGRDIPLSPSARNHILDVYSSDWRYMIDEMFCILHVWHKWGWVVK